MPSDVESNLVPNSTPSEEIFEEYVNEDQYLENIHGFIENLLQELIDEKPKIDESTIFKLNYDNDGNVINQLEF